jgi:hypothetical protein
MRTRWPTCCATSPTNLLGSGKTSAQQVVQLVGHWSCRSPTSRHSQCPVCWPTSWLSGAYLPTSCTTSSCLVHQTRWPTCSYIPKLHYANKLANKLATCWPTVHIVEFGHTTIGQTPLREQLVVRRSCLSLTSSLVMLHKLANLFV